ncbi:MAG: TldD/PmbA family protein [Proteobacteria bacterium]|nr:TldD/PmbA family protein [Pseudomonadota bacterium]
MTKASPSKLLEQAMSLAKKQGADQADALLLSGSNLVVRQRMGKLETLERAEENALGLRVLVKADKGFRSSMVSTNDMTEKDIPELVERVVAMAKAAPPDPFVSLADEKRLTASVPDLKLADTKEATEEQLKSIAAETEAAALAVKGVTNSEGAEVRYSNSEITLATSQGFLKSYKSTSFSSMISAIAGTGTGMETDYAYAVSRHLKSLKSPKDIGQEAGNRAVKRLNPRKTNTQQVPIVFEWRVASSLLGSFAGAINGASIARGVSFLKDSMNKPVFGANITIIDDPLLVGGLASHPFDGEGVAGKKLKLIDQGVLTSWILDTRSARQLNLSTTGHATRGTSSPPRPSSSNLYMENGKVSVKDLLAGIKTGFYVTDAFGMGVNDVTGDYSQGASGFWIENGELAYAVSEVTIAGNLKDMFMALTPANDLEMRYGTNAPTVRIDGMTIAGN